MTDKLADHLDTTIEIPDLGQLRVVGKCRATISNKNNFDVILTFIPVKANGNKVEFIVTMDGDGGYRFFDRSEVKSRVEFFDGVGLA